jgi:TetR/AcrR family transcriptional regulator, cholesterol catabolism regulator
MDTKEKILNRTGELFQLMGVKSLTMDFIAVDLGISKRTIYELFRDKDELMLQAVEYWIKSNNLKLIEIVNRTENVIEAIFVMIEHQHRQMATFNPVIFEDLKKYFVRLNASFYANREKCREFSITYTLLDKGKKEGVFREKLKIDIVNTFIFELLNMVHNSLAIKLMSLDRNEVLDNILLPYFRGICTSKGQELMETYIHKLGV